MSFLPRSAKTLSKFFLLRPPYYDLPPHFITIRNSRVSYNQLFSLANKTNLLHKTSNNLDIQRDYIFIVFELKLIFLRYHQALRLRFPLKSYSNILLVICQKKRFQKSLFFMKYLSYLAETCSKNGQKSRKILPFKYTFLRDANHKSK